MQHTYPVTTRAAGTLVQSSQETAGGGKWKHVIFLMFTLAFLIEYSFIPKRGNKSFMLK